MPRSHLQVAGPTQTTALAHLGLCVLLLCAACDDGATSPAAARECGDGIVLFSREQDTVFVIDRRFVSEVMVVNRSQELSAAQFVIGSPSRQIVYEAGSSVAHFWCSTDTNVVRNEGGKAVAVSAGAATVYVWDAAMRGDSLPIEVIATAYDLTFVGADVGAGSVAIALNDSGDVVGNGPSGYFVWREGSITPIASCVPTSINNFRQISCANAALWSSGVVTPVAIPDADGPPTVTAITDSGFIAGWITRGIHRWAFVTGRWDTAYRFIDQYGGVVTRANDRREIIGEQSDGLYPHAARWSAAEPYGTHIGDRRAAANDITAEGVIVGLDRCMNLTTPGTGTPRPFVWLPGTVQGRPLGARPCSVPLEPTVPSGAALGANDVGEIVGIIGDLSTSTTSGQAALWRQNRTIVLDHVVADQAWTITNARDIDDSGHILAHGINSQTGQSGIVLVHARAR